MENTNVRKATLERAPVEAGVIIKSETLTTQTPVAAGGAPPTLAAPGQPQTAKKENHSSAPVAACAKFGLDVHAAQITVCRQLDGSLPQPAHRHSQAEVLALAQEHLCQRSRGFDPPSLV